MQIAPYERIFIPLDVKVFGDAEKRLIDDVAPYVGGYKIGITAYFNKTIDPRISAGAEIESYIALNHPTKKIFVDGKFKDIPDQVGGAAAGVALAGFWGFTIHADNTPAAIRAAVLNSGISLVIGVTVLTSYDRDDCEDTYHALPTDAVLKFAKRLNDNGGNAIVCSPLELKALSDTEFGRGLLKITPGIRDPDSPPDDQMRTATAFEAARDGADFYVIGRLLTRSQNKTESAKRLVDDISRGMAVRV